MSTMFRSTTSFNGYIWRWDVSRVVTMDSMCQDATSFQQNLCGAAWVQSKARKSIMFEGSSGSISAGVCTAFSPQSKEELKSAVNTCFKLSPHGDCSNSLYGPMWEWGVSSVTDMSGMFSQPKFYSTNAFNADISQWDLSRVTTMLGIFASASSFDGNLSEWDVSRVNDMGFMFSRASSFNGDISKWDVSSVIDIRSYKFV